MYSTLHVFDLKPFIHAGSVNTHSKLEKVVQLGPTWKTQITPTGGISLVFNTLYSIVGTGDIVVCTDRNPTIKKEMLSTYKQGRPHKSMVEVGSAAAEYILDKCDCSLVARSGYEADDLIYTIVNKCHNRYEHIYIYTSDSDLYFLVDKKVSIKPSSTRAKEVTYSNYNEVLKKKKAVYNSLTMQKIIGGDPSDNIPGLPSELKKRMINLFYTPELLPVLGDYNFVRYMCQMHCPDAIPQVDLVFPMMVDDVCLDFKEPNKYLIRNFGSAMNNKMFYRLGDADFDIDPYVEDMHRRGIYLEEG